MKAELDAAIETQSKRRKPEIVDPSLILRVRMDGGIMEKDWEAVGLTVLSVDPDRTLILFSSNDEQKAFKERIDAYKSGPPANQKTAPYNNFISSIVSVGAVEPRDRIGLRLREQGIVDLADVVAANEYVLDIELWDIGTRPKRESRVEAIGALIAKNKGEVFDHYIGHSITMMRAKVSGKLLLDLLAIDEIAAIDLPPEPDSTIGEVIDLDLGALPVVQVDAAAPLIGIIDSGINNHPLLAGAIVGAIGAPETLGAADDYGHGTRVGGIAIFGDIRQQLASGNLVCGARLCSAKVVNNRGEFDEKRLVPSQMKEAITKLHRDFGCRIFVLSLADKSRPYAGQKVGTWAATLDELARELDCLIVVAAGNGSPPSGREIDLACTTYPRYLLEPGNRFLEPAGAVNVLTVGALAHGEGIGEDLAGDVRVRAITRANEPSPFSRIGPGVQGGTKPDLVDFGGTLIVDTLVARLRNGADYPAAGVVTLNHDFLRRLFVGASGTSFAAPRVAFAAAQVSKQFPAASANLLRALLVNSAAVPDEARVRLDPLGEDRVWDVCGHGLINVEQAAYSDDHRVVSFAEDELQADHFAVFRIPIPDIFRQSTDERKIRVTLAYDPPVRHTRADYQGARMNFRLLRGCDPDLIFEHFRKRSQAEGPVPQLLKKYDCDLKPGSKFRETGPLQSATISFKRNIDQYGDAYYLVVRCASGWAGAEHTQRFAVVVEVLHRAGVQLYDRMRVRLRA
ncbi:MAG: S8 family peptidase [Hyphomonadaceae bacterium]|nr:S8 family peptidase [Hyphomonadaceae bacterium]